MSRRSVHRLAHVVVGMAAVLGAGALVASVAAMLAGARSLDGAPGGAHDFAVAGEPLTYPAANLAALVVVALAGTGVIALLRGARAIARHTGAARRLRRTAGGRVDAGTGHVTLADARPVAFCAGLLTPRVYVSVGALRVLRDEELRAVLAHEEHHRRRRDPLRVALVAWLAEALFFLPAVARLRDRYAALAELRADDAAVAACGGDPGPLASAMMVFDAAGTPALAVGIAPERVDRLLGAPARLDVSRATLVLGALTVATMLTAAWRAGRTASLKATFALPVLSHRPCVVALMAVPLALAGVAALVAVRAGRAAR